jgi:hypothetical protein
VDGITDPVRRHHHVWIEVQPLPIGDLLRLSLLAALI